MITVTDSAKEELKRILETRRLEPGQSLRLTTPPVWTGDGDFGIVIDFQRDGDYTVEHEGVNVLYVDPNLMELLDTGVVDFKETSQGVGFAVDVY
ncbi:MAG: hypothetical protein HW403_1263 [Dehalococcoidia bacterium]|nr:hypothetical protein [Dehalococcoidia bacterium]